MKKKALFFVIYSLEKAGGSERVTSILANKLTEFQEYDITVIVLYGRNSFFKFYDVNILFLDEYLSRCGLLSKAISLIRFINTKKPDIIIGISINKLNLFLSFLSFFFLCHPLVIASEHIAFSNSTTIFKFLKRVLYKRFDKIIVLTKFDHDIMLTKGFNNVLIIQNPTSFFSKENSPILSRAKNIVAIGRLSYQKGFDRLLRIWQAIHLKYPQWNLSIYGEGEDYDSLMQLKSELFGQSSQCNIFPFTTHIADILQQSQIFALTSRFEGLPMVLIEALSAGCAIISYDCKTGPREIINNGYDGILVDDGDSVMFTKKIEFLITSDALKEELHKNSLITRKRYDSDNIINQWLKVFNGT